MTSAFSQKTNAFQLDVLCGLLKGAGDTLLATFMSKCDRVMLAEGCDRTTAMQIVRKRHQGLFDAFQVV
jgi:hypothetical protein